MPCVCAEPFVVGYAGLGGRTGTGFAKPKCDHRFATVSAVTQLWMLGLLRKAMLASIFFFFMRACCIFEVAKFTSKLLETVLVARCVLSFVVLLFEILILANTGPNARRSVLPKTGYTG